MVLHLGQPCYQFFKIVHTFSFDFIDVAICTIIFWFFLISLATKTKRAFLLILLWLLPDIWLILIFVGLWLLVRWLLVRWLVVDILVLTKVENIIIILEIIIYVVEKESCGGAGDV